jgi:hypothetical protein
MNWIFVGMLAGSLVTSTHDTKEACVGRAETLKEKSVVGKCIEHQPPFSYTTCGSCVITR